MNFKKLLIFSLLGFSCLLVACGGQQTKAPENTETSQDSTANITEATSETPQQETEATSQSTTNWAGEYTYEETGGPGMGGEPRQWFHSLVIEKEGDNYKANYDIDGYQTMARLLLSGTEQNGELVFIFDGVGEEHMMGYEGSEGQEFMKVKMNPDGTLVIDQQGTEMIFTKK